MIDLLALEPFDYKPWEIARLTDLQVTNLLAAQAARQEALERERRGLGPAAPEAPADPGPDWQPSRTFMVNALMQLGMSKADAVKEYEWQLARNAKDKAK